jgi:tRNA(Ile)-lysidine synthase
MTSIESNPELRRFYWRWENELKTLLQETPLSPATSAASAVPPRLLAAVSGGRDSVALAWLLEQSRQRSVCDLALAHINHQLRPTAPEDEAFVLRLGARWGVPVGIKSVNVKRHAAKAGQSPEQAARELRYEGLRELAGELDCHAIVLGHHMDDQAETVLLRLLRGTGPRGIGAMAPVTVMPGSIGLSSMVDRMVLLRPLLKFRRSEIAELAEAASLDWRDDESNADCNIKRNQIRHELLPQLLEGYNPRLVEALSDLAARQRGSDELIGNLAHDLYIRAKVELPNLDQPPNVSNSEGAIALDRRILIDFHPAIVTRVLYIAYQDLVGSETTLSSTHMDALLHLAGLGPPIPGSSPREVHLPQRVRAKRRKDGTLILEFHAPYDQESS